jgi:O-antigen/teichoic acid export membrane protein
MTSPRRRVLWNIAWLMGERMARIAAGLAVGVAVARYLGPDNFGKISYIQAIVAVVATIAGMGLEPILMKELVTSPAERNIAYSTALGIAGITSMTATIVGLLYSFLFVDDAGMRVLYVLGFATMPLQTAAIIAVPLQAEEKFALLVRYQLLQIAFSMVLRCLLIFLRASLGWFMFAYTVDAAVWVLLLVFLKAMADHRTSFAARDVKFHVGARLAGAAAPLFATNLVVLLQIRIDQMLLGMLASAAAVGNFAVASKLSEGLMQGPAIVVRALNPQMLQAKARSEGDFRSVLRRQFEVSVMIAVVIATAFSAASGLLVRILFGPQYHDAAAPLAILVWIIVPMTIGSVNANAVIAQSQTKQTLAKATIGMSMNALLNYLFIPRWGATGSAIATLTSHVCSAYLGMLIFPQQRFQFVYASRALVFPATLFHYRREIYARIRRLR